MNDDYEAYQNMMNPHPRNENLRREQLASVQRSSEPEERETLYTDEKGRQFYFKKGNRHYIS